MRRIPIAQHVAGQRRAVAELQLIGDVATADVQLDTVAAVVGSRRRVSWPGYVAACPSSAPRDALVYYQQSLSHSHRQY